ncbi:hypothetical protein [Catenulispora subtropica]|uniref:Uncharacterized protein n=1 Tax=Catenulispora subtropica TaxID=450798 RepID=A0ABP5D0T4_9ACTN
MKREFWLAVFIALVIAGLIVNKQAPGGYAPPPAPVPAVVSH